MKPVTIDYVISKLPSGTGSELPAPEYNGWNPSGAVLGVEQMKRHMTDEGWQIQEGLMKCGYKLCGQRLPVDCVHVPQILADVRPGIVFVQDKREWGLKSPGFRDQSARFTQIESLVRSDIFRLTVLKDSHQNNSWNREAATEIGCHAWVIYYNERIVKHLAPYVRERHLIRTFHSVDADLIPDYSPEGRQGCLLSGAVSRAYPLRQSLVANVNYLPETYYLKHPGYHANGSATTDFLKTLSQYRVAICTASRYGYALRKLIEATACGCSVITDLPVDERLPGIDENLYRIHPKSSPQEVAVLIRELLLSYDPERQEYLAQKAKMFYDYREVGRRLANDIESLRCKFSQPKVDSRNRWSARDSNFAPPVSTIPVAIVEGEL